MVKNTWIVTEQELLIWSVDHRMERQWWWRGWRILHKDTTMYFCMYCVCEMRQNGEWYNKLTYYLYIVYDVGWLRMNMVYWHWKTEWFIIKAIWLGCTIPCKNDTIDFCTFLAIKRTPMKVCISDVCQRSDSDLGYVWPDHA